MKPESQESKRFRFKPESNVSLESRLLDHFSKLKQPSADFDQRLFDKIRALPSGPTAHCH